MANRLVLNGVDLADSSHPLPERVGTFSLHSRLGQSKSGIVLDATTAQEVHVALKLALPPLEAEDRREETARLLRELSILKALHHPGIVRLVDAGLLGGLLYMAVERVEGVTLRTLIDDETADFDVVAAIGLQVGSTIAHLHTVGILQREITPDVIIVRPSGELLLADFGFSTFVGAPAITEPGPPRATLGYVAPELFEIEKATPASDQYALGRLLFELCTPAQRSSIRANQATPAERQAAGWVDWASFPTGAYHRSLKPVLERMLSIQPSARYPDVYTAVAEIATLTAYKGLVDAGMLGGRGRSSTQRRSMSGERALAVLVDRVQHLQEDERNGALWRTISDSFSDLGAPLYASSYLLVEPPGLDRVTLLRNVCRQSERAFAERDASRVAAQLMDDARTFWEDRAKSTGWNDDVTPIDLDPEASTAPGNDVGSDTVFDAVPSQEMIPDEGPEEMGARTVREEGFSSDDLMSESPRISSDDLLPPSTESYQDTPPKFLPVPRSISGTLTPRAPPEELEEQMHADTVSEALVIPRNDGGAPDPANEPQRWPLGSFEATEQELVHAGSRLRLVQILMAAALLLVGLVIGFIVGRG